MQAERRADYFANLKRGWVGLGLTLGLGIPGLWFTIKALQVSPGLLSIRILLGGLLAISLGGVIVFASHLYWLVSHYRQTQHWVVCFRHRHNLVGRLQLAPENQCWRLRLVSIEPDHRRQGLGRALVQTAQSRVRKPIIVACTPAARAFFLSVGFTPITSHRLPQNWRFQHLLLPYPTSRTQPRIPHRDRPV